MQKIHTSHPSFASTLLQAALSRPAKIIHSLRVRWTLWRLVKVDKDRAWLAEHEVCEQAYATYLSREFAEAYKHLDKRQEALTAELGRLVNSRPGRGC